MTCSRGTPDNWSLVMMSTTTLELCLLISLCLIFPDGTQGGVIIRHGPSHQRVRAGTTVTFRCLADIEPLPLIPSNDVIASGLSIEWKKDGRTLASGRSPVAVADRMSHVTWRQDGRQLTVANVTSSDSGLYSCTARHKDDVDTASAQLTVEDVPDPPVDVQIVSCDARVVQLKWRLAAENNSPVTQYIVEYNTSFRPDTWQVAKTQQARDRYQRITLSPWGNYSFRIIAQNAVGVSRPSVPTRSTCQTPPDVPHINPRGVCTKNVRPHTLAISWEPMPLEEQNAPGFHYLIRWRRHDSIPTATYEERTVAAKSSSLIMEGHPIYKPYEIFVLAINEIGDAASPPRLTLGYSAEDVPQETPQSFRLNPDKPVTDRTADFQWTSVNTGPWRMQGFFRGYKIQFWKTSDGMATMREHSIIYQEPSSCWRHLETAPPVGNAAQLVTANSPAAAAAAATSRISTSHGTSSGRRRKRDVNSAHVYNLWPYTNVSAQIVALNAMYEGPPSNTISFRTKEGAPGPVRHLVVISRGSHHVRIGWEAPAEMNGRLLGYTLTHKVLMTSSSLNSANEEDQVHEVEEIKTRLTLQGLTPQQTYRLTLCARTGAGRGVSSYIDVKTLPHGAPVAPNYTAIPLDQNSLNVTWYTPPDGIPGTSFSVYYRLFGSERPVWTHAVDESEKEWAVISGLDPGVVYEMKIMARNGDSEDSPKSTSRIGRIRTGSREPLVRIIHRNPGSLSIDLAERDLTVRSFYVQYRPDGTFNWQTTERVNVNRQVSLAGLEYGVKYEVRAVVQTDISGEVTSAIQFVVIGSVPDAQASRGGADIIRRMTNGGSCSFTLNINSSCLTPVLIAVTFSVLQHLKYSALLVYLYDSFSALCS